LYLNTWYPDAALTFVQLIRRALSLTRLAFTEYGHPIPLAAGVSVSANEYATEHSTKTNAVVAATNAFLLFLVCFLISLAPYC
jgi:hypothetical protein